jgi:type I restriction enzyme, S subunit
MGQLYGVITIVALEEKLVKARQLKQGMMQELLTGKTRLVESAK